MRKLLLLGLFLVLAGCGDRITRAVIIKDIAVADSLRHDHGNHFGQDSTKIIPPKDALR